MVNEATNQKMIFKQSCSQKSLKYFVFANEQAIKKSYNNAIYLYTLSIVYKPRNVSAYFNRGIINRRIGEYKSAIEDFNMVIEINPDKASAYLNRGLIFSMLGHGNNKSKNKLRSIADYSSAIKIDKYLANAYLYRGIAKSDLNNLQDAIKDLTTFTKLAPDVSKGYYLLGKAKHQLYKSDHGCKDWIKASELGCEESVKLISKFCNN